TFCKQADIEAMCSRIKVDRFLFRRQQIKKQSRKTPFVQRSRDKLISRTVPAAGAAVREKDKPLRLFDNRQISVERRAPRRNLDFFAHARALTLALVSRS